MSEIDDELREAVAAALRAGTMTPSEAAARISNDAACVLLMEWREI